MWLPNHSGGSIGAFPGDCQSGSVERKGTLLCDVRSLFIMEWRPSPSRHDGRHPNTNRVPGGPGPLTNPLTAWREIPESRGCSSRYPNPDYQVILLGPQGRRVGGVGSILPTPHGPPPGRFSQSALPPKPNAPPSAGRRPGGGSPTGGRAKSPIGRRGLLPTSRHSSWVIP